MGLHQLELRNFRLFEHLVLLFEADSVTVMQSENGTGKTSVLEAIYALATASSFRTHSAADMVRTGEGVAEVHGVMSHQQRRVQIDLTLTRGARNVTKKMLVNGQRPRSRADISAALPVTVFTPEGVDMVRHGPEQRRVFLTNVVTDVDLTAGEMVERFERTLRQRNAFLKALRGDNPSPSQRDELAVWDGDFVATSHALVALREKIVAALSPLVSDFYERLSLKASDIRVSYERSWNGDLASALPGAWRDDLARGHSTLGPQRDDVSVTINGRDARRQASQGEQRSLALALRLAGHELVRETRRVDPLLLLDDVFSELDPGRSQRLLGLLPVGQTLVTTAIPLAVDLPVAHTFDLSTVARGAL